MRRLTSGQSWGCWLQIFALLLVILVLSVVVIWIGGDRLVELAKVIKGEAQVIDTISINVEEARRTHKTEYAQMRITEWVKGTEAKDPFGLIKSDRILIISGTCVAGIDYDKKAQDIKVNGGTVIATLPAPDLFRCGVDKAEFLDAGGLIPASTDMNNELMLEAQRKLEMTALDQGIIELAREQAKIVEELTLRRLGFSTVTVAVMPAEEPAK